MSRIRGQVILLIALGALSLPSRAQADLITAPDFTVTGTEATGLTFGGQFIHDNDYALIPLSIDLQSTLVVTIGTYNLDAGGFDPMLFLLDDTGAQATGLDVDGVTPIQVYDQDAGTTPLQAILTPGKYTLVISQLFNYPNITSPGFAFDSDPLYTCGLYLGSVEGCNGFIDPFIDPEGPVALSGTIAGSIAVTPVNQPEPVPEPSTLVLMASGIGYVATRRRRKRSAAAS